MSLRGLHYLPVGSMLCLLWKIVFSRERTNTAMLSILIPVYQYDVCPLVRDLHRQAEALTIPWEIICLDDGSDEFWRRRNQEIRHLTGVRYEEAVQNMGRSRVRNQLAELAAYPFLQFMDCDSGVVRSDFISKYVGCLTEDTVLCGGRIYAANRPRDDDFSLHWLYGTEREAHSAEQRAKEPHHSFMSNNFVVPASTMRAIPFDERLTDYGHEDTLFGQQLARAGIAVRHLDNPLEHVGLETAAAFLAKAENAVYNLAFLRKQDTLLQTRLTETYDHLHRRGFLPLATIGLSWLEGCFRKNLLSRHPDLRIFDAWRLGLFMQAMRA